MFCMFRMIVARKRRQIRARAGRFRAGYRSDLSLFSFDVAMMYISTCLVRYSGLLYLYYIRHKSRISRSIYLHLSRPRESAMHPYPSLGSRHGPASTNGQPSHSGPFPSTVLEDPPKRSDSPAHPLAERSHSFPSFHPSLRKRIISLTNA